MCLRDSELKNAAERVCNAYSKLSNVATAEVVHTDSLELVVDIGRGHRWDPGVATLLTPWKPALQWGHCGKMSSLLLLAMAMITPTQCLQTTAHPHGSRRTCGFLSMQATQRGAVSGKEEGKAASRKAKAKAASPKAKAASRIWCRRGGPAAGEASWRGRRFGRG